LAILCKRYCLYFYLWIRSIFYLYALQYIDGQGKKIQAQFPNLAKFRDNFKLSEKEIKDFIAFAESKEVKFVEKDYESEKLYIVARLKAQIARNYWKNEGWYTVLLPVDKQLEKALSLFPKAEEMARAK